MARRVRSSNAFDPERPDAEESSLRPRPQQEQPASMRDLLPPVAAAARPKPVEPAADVKASTRPRGNGGRPSPNDGGGVSVIPARVPIDVYGRTSGLVKGEGRPSWGQLVAWVCHTRRTEVASRVVANLKSSESLTLRPRGQNVQGAGAQPVAARLMPAEQVAFQAAREEAVRSVVESGVAPASKVTATSIIVAALELAAEDPPGLG